MSRRLPTLLILCAWLLAAGAQWDLLQGFAWGRMVASYSRTMPLAEAIRLTFTPGNLCSLCEIVADAHTRSDPAGSAADDASRRSPPADPAAKAKAPLATPPEHLFVFASAPPPAWPAEHFEPDARARPAPPTEPPRAA